MVSTYSVTHFIVDFSCAFLIFRYVAATPEWYIGVLLYNFCAFAMRMPLGIIVDIWNRNYLISALGCVTVAAAFILPPFSPGAVAVVAGIGSAMFHVGGGVDVLNVCGEKSGPLGVFLAPGAWGIYLGAIFGLDSGQQTILIMIILFAAAGFIFVMHRAYGEVYTKNAAFSLDSGVSSQVFFVIACLFVAVCLRSYVDLAFNFPWVNIDHWGLILACAVVLGQAVGGFAADRFGVAKSAFLSLGVAAPFFFLSQIPLAGVAAILLFNITMPVKLWVMAKIFPGAKGFAFGLFNFALFSGFLFVYFDLRFPLNLSWAFALVSAVSLVLFLVGLKRTNLWARR